MKATISSEGLTEARKLANQGLERPQALRVQTKIKGTLNLQGVELAAGTQSIFYQTLCEQCEIRSRRSTTIQLAITKHAVRDLNESFPTDEEI